MMNSEAMQASDMASRSISIAAIELMPITDISTVTMTISIPRGLPVRWITRKPRNSSTPISTISTIGIGRVNDTSDDINHTITRNAIGAPNTFLGSKALRLPAISPTGSAAISAGIEDCSSGASTKPSAAAKASRIANSGSSASRGRGATYMPAGSQ